MSHRRYNDDYDYDGRVCWCWKRLVLVFAVAFFLGAAKVYQFWVGVDCDDDDTPPTSEGRTALEAILKACQKDSD